jgi:hypothetical protein
MLVGDLLDQAHTHQDVGWADDLRLVTAVSPALSVLTVPTGWPLPRPFAALARPQVTAVVLTCDDQELIGRCLQSLADDADEFLVIDWGSTDRTLEIVKSQHLPVRIVHAPWRDDFGRQRNLAFDHVTDGWLLMVGADEVLTADARGTIRRSLLLLDQLLGGSDFAICPQIADADDPGGLHTDLPRALRAGSALRYRGRVHERPYDPCGRAARSVHISSRFTRYGQGAEAMAAKRKHERHKRLLALSRVEEPENPKWTFYQVRDELQHPTGPDRSRELSDQLEQSLVRCPPDAPDYFTERNEDSWAVLCQLALRSGAQDSVEAYAARLDDVGRTAEAAYYRTTLAMNRAMDGLAQLGEDIRSKAVQPSLSSVRVIGRLHELDGFLALATGRYELVAPALLAAHRYGAGTDLGAVLAELRNAAAQWHQVV